MHALEQSYVHLHEESPPAKQLIYAKVGIGTGKLTVGVLIDIGSSCNVMPKNSCERLGLMI